MAHNRGSVTEPRGARQGGGPRGGLRPRGHRRRRGAPRARVLRRLGGAGATRARWPISTSQVERRSDLRVAFPWARSVVCVALQYDTPQPYSTEAPAGARLDRALRLGRRLPRRDEGAARSPGRAPRGRGSVRFGSRSYVDTGPIAERAYAAAAGLGAWGKNTCLLHPEHGSWFFLGELVTRPRSRRPTRRAPTCAGRCTACLDACPTGAFPAPYVLDATRCISYLTIEMKGAIPEDAARGRGPARLRLRHLPGRLPLEPQAATSRRAGLRGAAGARWRPTWRELAGLDEAAFRERFRQEPGEAREAPRPAAQRGRGPRQQPATPREGRSSSAWRKTRTRSSASTRSGGWLACAQERSKKPSPESVSRERRSRRRRSRDRSSTRSSRRARPSTPAPSATPRAARRVRSVASRLKSAASSRRRARLSASAAAPRTAMPHARSVVRDGLDPGPNRASTRPPTSAPSAGCPGCRRQRRRRARASPGSTRAARRTSRRRRPRRRAAGASGRADDARRRARTAPGPCRVCRLSTCSTPARRPSARRRSRARRRPRTRPSASTRRRAPGSRARRAETAPSARGHAFARLVAGEQVVAERLDHVIEGARRRA